jgi:hypothetical protein
MTGEAPSCYTASTPTARKPHKCCECRGLITPGEKYHRFSGIWDGEADTYKTCADCQKLREDVCREDDLGIDDMPSFRHLGDWMDTLERKRRFVAIMEKRGATVHESWRKSIVRMEKEQRTPSAG